MALAAALQGIDGFGAEIWSFDPFWWNAGAILEEVPDRFQPADPWPGTWEARLSPEEVKAIARRNPVRFEHHADKAEHLMQLLETAREVKVAVYE
jgi:hypothetical protein